MTAWLDSDERFLAELLRGKRTELRFAIGLLGLGFGVKISPLQFRETFAERAEFDDECDVRVEGRHRLEVKGRAFSFTSPESYPYPTAFLGSQRRWLARTHLPCAVVLVSEVTGDLLVAFTGDRDGWLVEMISDHVRAIPAEANATFAAPRSLLRPFDDLLDHLATPCPPNG